MLQAARKVESRRMPGFTGREWCERLSSERPGSEGCLGKTTRHYGEMLGHAFTGWRGPYCSVQCYLAEYPPESEEA